MPLGIVIRLDTAACVVLCDGETIRCPLPGRWRLTRRDQPRAIAVGDRLDVSVTPTGEGLLGTIHPRQGGVLARRAAGDRDVQQVVAANVDQLIAVVAAEDPPLNRRLLDRLIVSGEHGELGIVVCINKMDLVEPGSFQSLVELYRKLGYRAFATSAVTGHGVDEFRDALKDKTSVFAGPSGVGKSRLLMRVEPDLDLRVQPVSESTGKGRHTTSAVSLLPLGIGGCLVDTPGIREFALYDIERDELQHYFPEIAERFGQCRFADCSHLHEPECAVVAAVGAGEIDPGRYDSYCRIYEGLPEPDPSRGRR